MDPVDQFLFNLEASRPQVALPPSLSQLDQILDDLNSAQTLPAVVILGASIFSSICWYMFWVTSFVDFYRSRKLREFVEDVGFDLCLVLCTAIVLWATGTSVWNITWVLILWVWFVDRGLAILGVYVDAIYEELIGDVLEEVLEVFEDWIVLCIVDFLEKFCRYLWETERNLV